VRAILRDPSLATDTSSTEAVMIDFAERFPFDRLVLIQATSPLTTASDLDGALRHMTAVGADSLLTVTHEHRFRWRSRPDGFVEAINYEPQRRPRRQDWSGELCENGAFYVCGREGLLATKCRLHGKIAHFTMSSHTAVEIDEPSDWEILEALMRRAFAVRPTLNKADIQLLITDVDGVLTDAGMYYGADGELMKKFSTRDGMGTHLWAKAGRQLAIVTGENSPIVLRRAEKLRISEVHLGISDKKSVVRAIMQERKLAPHQVAYIGDDVNDLEAMAEVGIVACPADAQPSVRAVAQFVCKARGGEGCLREFVDHLLA
jgi:YrbI family 3-deoxy-D-manno-octulosonate 8-phosphate phosphatase